MCRLRRELRQHILQSKVVHCWLREGVLGDRGARSGLYFASVRWDRGRYYWLRIEVLWPTFCRVRLCGDPAGDCAEVLCTSDKRWRTKIERTQLV
jgi:hypothetical protein